MEDIIHYTLLKKTAGILLLHPQSRVQQGPIPSYLLILDVETFQIDFGRITIYRDTNIWDLTKKQQICWRYYFLHPWYIFFDLLFSFSRFKFCAGLSNDVEKMVARPLGIFQHGNKSTMWLKLNYSKWHGSKYYHSSKWRRYFLQNFKSLLRTWTVSCWFEM